MMANRMYRVITWDRSAYQVIDVLSPGEYFYASDKSLIWPTKKDWEIEIDGFIWTAEIVYSRDELIDTINFTIVKEYQPTTRYVFNLPYKVGKSICKGKIPIKPEEWRQAAIAKADEEKDISQYDKLWLTLIRITGIDSKNNTFTVILPARDFGEHIILPMETIPKGEIVLGNRFHAYVNIGAENIDDLHFERFEFAKADGAEEYAMVRCFREFRLLSEKKIYHGNPTNEITPEDRKQWEPIRKTLRETGEVVIVIGADFTRKTERKIDDR